jgi:hypothetical protein
VKGDLSLTSIAGSGRRMVFSVEGGPTEVKCLVLSGGRCPAKNWRRGGATIAAVVSHARPVARAQVESALFVRLRDLFSLQVDMVFYDLTSTYFEGRKPTEMGAHGHSRDGKPRNRLATAEQREMRAGRRPIKVVWLTITDIGRLAPAG